MSSGGERGGKDDFQVSVKSYLAVTFTDSHEPGGGTDW